MGRTGGRKEPLERVGGKYHVSKLTQPSTRVSETGRRIETHPVGGIIIGERDYVAI